MSARTPDWLQKLSHAPWLDLVLMIVASLVTIMLFFGFLGWVIPENGGQFGKERAKCNEAVARLLGSNDLVEITRAGIIVQRLNCDIGRRL